MSTITQFGTIFAAVGCKLNYNSKETSLEVVESPKGKAPIIDKAIADIEHFDECPNYMDGAAALLMADTIDDVLNPLSSVTRVNVLNGLGITKDGRYIHQVLSLQKNNRSWHISEKANDCSYFGENCTHRGIKPDPNRKGRRSFRQPDEYHRLDGKGKPSREQLVTPALEKMFQSIPESNLISSGHSFMSLTINLKEMKKLTVEEKLRVISELEESII